MKPLIIVLALLVMAGCGSFWVEDNRPETDKERECVERVQAGLLSKIPSTLSGHDQDWDDAIVAAHKAALKTCCKPRLYEYRPEFSGPRETGRMKEVQR